MCEVDKSASVEVPGRRLSGLAFVRRVAIVVRPVLSSKFRVSVWFSLPADLSPKQPRVGQSRFTLLERFPPRCPPPSPTQPLEDSVQAGDAVGSQVTAGRGCLLQVISELNGKNIEDVIAQGIGKLASVPAGGAVAVSAAPGSAAPAAGSAPAAAEEKKDEKKEESEESDDDMGFGLFD
ncbi:60S acidic ribosomal protein P2 [Tupaia chinensis]|uniref:60S acidic ribosomal protein P2 n=1 Tax=Tupaia chinensis TaxID=246437 RepID=UPI0003C8FE2B|nr:60S acidic ribosomal protein P2 [Tupaia chinensis]